MKVNSQVNAGMHAKTVLAIQPPFLEGMSFQEIRDFLRRFREVKSQLAVSGAPEMGPVRDYLSEGCIGALRMTANLPVKKESWTDCLVQEALEKHLGTGRGERLTFEEVVARNPMDLRISGVADRISKYQASMVEECQRLGVRWDISEERKKERKRKISALVEGIRPENLREVIKKDLDTAGRKVKSNYQAFFDFVGEGAAWQQKLLDAESQMRGKFLREGSVAGRRSEKRKTFGETSRRISQRPPSMIGSDSQGQKPWNKECFFCKGMHRLADCPTATIEQKDSCFEENGFKRSRRVGRVNPNSAYPVATLYEISRNAVEKLQCLLGDVFITQALLDSGATHSAMGMNVFEKLRELNVEMSVKKLDPPLTFRRAFDEEDENSATALIQALFELRISVTFGMKHAPERLVGAKFFVFEASSAIVIIGCPELKRLHLDPLTNLLERGGQLRLLQLEDKLNDLRLEQFPAAENSEEFSFDEGQYELASHVDQSAIRVAVEEMLERARRDGASEKFMTEIKKLVYKHENMWRVELGPDPPAQVTPMRAHLKPGTTPVKGAPYRAAPLEAKYLKEFVNQLIEVGMVYTNQDSAWASPAFPVPKPKSKGFRVVINTKEVNSKLEPTIWPMPLLATILQKLGGARCFALLDAFKGYWQFPLAEDSQEIFSFVTPDGVFTPRRVIQGGGSSVQAFQAGMEEALGRDLVGSEVLLWIDDLLAFGTGEQELLRSLRKIFERLDSRGIKLSPRKCELFKREAVWCGHVISNEGIRYEESLVRSLIEMPDPRNAAELQQFVSAANWMRDAIPSFAQVMLPLQQLLQTAARKTNSLRKQKLKKFQFDTNSWTPALSEAFHRAKSAIASQVMKVHLDPEKELCLFQDASQDAWSVMLTQIPEEDVVKPFEKQRHEPVAFLSGAFKGSSRRWAIIDKEAYPIFMAVTKLRQFLFRERGFRIFTDHLNLKYILDPTSASSSIGRHISDRRERWAVKLFTHKYIIEHVPGEQNVWADLLSRWGNQDTIGAVRSLRLEVPAGMVNPLRHIEHEWPSERELLELQNQGLENRRFECSRTKKGQFIVPFGNSGSFRLRLIIIAHCGSGGHRKVEATTSAVLRHFYWDGIRQDVKAFCDKCLHCLPTLGRKVPRPFGQTLTAEKPGEVVHFDYLYINKSETQVRYILVLKDDFSNFVRLLPTETADVLSVVGALLDWFSIFGLPKFFVSDQGSHFKNAVLLELGRICQVEHHFVTAYCPWANGTVERVNLEVLRILQALSSELKVSPTNWPSLVPVVQIALNHAIVKVLGDRSAIQVVTGYSPRTPLSALLDEENRVWRSTSLSSEEFESMFYETTQALLEMHKDVQSGKETLRDGRNNRRNQKKHVKIPNFEIGDFVLVARPIRHLRNKLNCVWKGPMQIVKSENEWVFQVRDMLTEHRELVHCTRMRFYSDKHLELTEDLKKQMAHDQEVFVVEGFTDLKYVAESKRFELLTKWQGLSEADNSWEPLSYIAGRMPDLVRRFLEVFSTKSRQAAVLVGKAMLALREGGLL